VSGSSKLDPARSPRGTRGVRLGVVGLGSVFWTPYMSLIERLRGQGRVEVTAVYDADPAKHRAAAARLDLPADLPRDVAVCEHPDVDVVLVLTSMTEHGRLTRAALAAGKHVLVEKPVATSLAEAEDVLAAAEAAPGHLVCAPHILLSPTYRQMHARVRAGEIGGLLTARARYGWAGPDWSRWFYEPGGGALFDLGVYNVTSLCGFFGPARRVTAMTGVAIPERVIDGEPVRVQAEDNAHVLIDFGDARFAVVTTGFTMQRYRSPCVELYGTHGVLQMLGDDWAPEGFELYRNDTAVWEVHPETEPTWPWTDGLRHLVECIETGEAPVTRPEHAHHALEIMLAAQAAGGDGRAREIRSGFPAPDLARLGPVGAGGSERVHDPRSAL
jgi:predicted dehydrogenase